MATKEKLAAAYRAASEDPADKNLSDDEVLSQLKTVDGGGAWLAKLDPPPSGVQQFKDLVAEGARRMAGAAQGIKDRIIQPAAQPKINTTLPPVKVGGYPLAGELTPGSVETLQKREEPEAAAGLRAAQKVIYDPENPPLKGLMDLGGAAYSKGLGQAVAPEQDKALKDFTMDSFKGLVVAPAAVNGALQGLKWYAANYTMPGAAAAAVNAISDHLVETGLAKPQADTLARRGLISAIKQGLVNHPAAPGEAAVTTEDLVNVRKAAQKGFLPQTEAPVEQVPEAPAQIEGPRAAPVAKPIKAPPININGIVQKQPALPEGPTRFRTLAEVDALPTDQMEHHILGRYEAKAPQKELNALEKLWDGRVADEDLQHPEGEDAAIGESEGPEGAGLGEDLAQRYYNNFVAVNHPQAAETPKEAIAGLRGILEDHAHKKLNVSDEDVLAAAKDYYDQRQALIGKYKAGAGKTQPEIPSQPREVMAPREKGTMTVPVGAAAIETLPPELGGPDYPPVETIWNEPIEKLQERILKGKVQPPPDGWKTPEDVIADTKKYPNGEAYRKWAAEAEVMSKGSRHGVPPELVKKFGLEKHIELADDAIRAEKTATLRKYAEDNGGSLTPAKDELVRSGGMNRDKLRYSLGIEKAGADWKGREFPDEAAPYVRTAGGIAPADFAQKLFWKNIIPENSIPLAYEQLRNDLALAKAQREGGDLTEFLPKTDQAAYGGDFNAGSYGRGDVTPREAGGDLPGQTFIPGSGPEMPNEKIRAGEYVDQQAFNEGFEAAPETARLFETPAEYMTPRDTVETAKAELGIERPGNINVGMLPGVTEAAEGIQAVSSEINKMFFPAEISDPAKMTKTLFVRNLGIMAREYDKAEAALLKAKKEFDKASKAANLDFIYKMEAGEKQGNKAAQKIADTLRAIADADRLAVQALGTGKLENFIENYFPHIWVQPNKAVDAVRRIYGRRPLQGTRDFLKKRTIESTKAGIERGLEPVSYNPVDLVLLKHREVQKYLMANRTLAEMKAQGLAKYVPIGVKQPDEWVQINDAMGTVYKSPMIQIQEAIDTAVMGGLEKVADKMGIGRKRKPKIGGSRLGYATQGNFDPATGKYTPGDVMTKFATSEEVLAHEIGHQIDWIYGLQKKFMGGKRPIADFIYDKMIAKAEREGRLTDAADYKRQQTINKELRDLGDATEGPKYWRRKGAEKMAIMVEELIHAPEEFKRIAPTVFEMFYGIVKNDPVLKDLLDIKPDVVRSQVRSAEIYAGGLVVSGHIYAQPDAAQLINNYLSPGLQGNVFYDLFRGAGNTLNQFQLGISAFHVGFTCMDATISKTAMGINKFVEGDIKGAAAAFAESLIAPVTNYLQGRKVEQSWYGKDNGEMTNLIAGYMAEGGGRAKMDQFYATKSKEAITKALQEGKLLTATLRLPWMVVEEMAKPLMENIVPRQKMGVFYDLMKMEIERNPGATHTQLVQMAQKISESVDNRMGQMVHDNLLWQRVTKDMAMLSVRSLGWNLGTIRELGGSQVDTVKYFDNMRQGKKPEFTYRMAYALALPMIAALYGAIYQYLHIEELPKELKDYYFPRTGGIDKNGHAARVSLPTYMKDVYHYGTAPVQTVLNKFNPIFNMLIEMYNNKDFYGVEIRHQDDPIIKQALQELKFSALQFEPFGFRNLNRDTRSTGGSKVEPFIGITPAPYDINMTPAEIKAQEYIRAHVPVGARTEAQAEKAQATAKVRNEYKLTGDNNILIHAAGDPKFDPADIEDIAKEKYEKPMDRYARRMTLPEIANVLKVANPEEKQILIRELDQKYDGVMKSDRNSLDDKLNAAEAYAKILIDNPSARKAAGAGDAYKALKAEIEQMKKDLPTEKLGGP